MAEDKKPRFKSLKVLEVARSGRIWWQTDSKMTATARDTFGFEEVDGEPGLWEVEKPKSGELASYGRQVTTLGFKLTRVELAEVKPKTVTGTALSLGERVLRSLEEAKEAEKEAKEFTAKKRGIMQDWLIENGAPKDPAHEDARVAQIGSKRVHNSWTRGNQTKWDMRDHCVIADWAEENDRTEGLVGVIVHRLMTYEEFERDGAPEGYSSERTIDPDIYECYERVGEIPKDLHESFEDRTAGYYKVMIYDTKELACDACGISVKKTQKFCHECGAKTGR